MTSETIRVKVDEITALVKDTLTSNGLSEEHADAVTHAIIAAERDDCRSHGLYRVAGCVNSVRSGRISPTNVPVLTERSGGVVKVDCKHTFTPLATRLFTPVLMQAAQENGIAAMALTNAFHFSALWVDLEEMATQGFVAFETTVAYGCVAWPGGKKPSLGTNPIAFAWPQKSGRPFIFDMSTSSMSRGDTDLHRIAGKPLPRGYAIDEKGDPTTDAAEALQGALLPFGGYKGAAICLMAELLAGPLIGDISSMESRKLDIGDGGPNLGGVLVLAIDPRRFSSSGNLADGFLDDIRDGGNIRLPSDRRYIARERNAEYLNVSAATLKIIEGLRRA